MFTYFITVVPELKNYKIPKSHMSGVGRLLAVKRGPRNFFRDFADIAKWSQASKANQYQLEGLAFLTLNYAFSHFSRYFFFKLFIVHSCE